MVSDTVRPDEEIKATLKRRTTLPVFSGTKERLAEHSPKGTWDGLINGLIDRVDALDAENKQLQEDLRGRCPADKKPVCLVDENGVSKQVGYVESVWTEGITLKAKIVITDESIIETMRQEYPSVSNGDEQDGKRIDTKK